MAVKIVTFTGNNGNGAISVAGLLSGDRVVAVIATSNLPVGQDETSSFCSFIFSDGEIQQVTAGDLSSYGFTALIERNVVLP